MSLILLACLRSVWIGKFEFSALSWKSLAATFRMQRVAKTVPLRRYGLVQMLEDLIIYLGSFFFRHICFWHPCRWSLKEDIHSSIELQTNKERLKKGFTTQQAVPYCLMHSFPPYVTTLQDKGENFLWSKYDCSFMYVQESNKIFCLK